MTDPSNTNSELDRQLAGFGFADPTGALADILVFAETFFRPSTFESVYWILLEEEQPSRRESASAFQAAATADNPLDRINSDQRRLLNTLMQRRWSSREAKYLGFPQTLESASWSDLSQESQKCVRDALEHLAAYERSYLKRGRPSKTEIDDWLWQLAEIYARHSLFEGSHWELPANEDSSRFVRFACWMLQLTALDPSERTPSSVAIRWRRIKKRHFLNK